MTNKESIGFLGLITVAGLGLTSVVYYLLRRRSLDSSSQGIESGDTGPKSVNADDDLEEGLGASEELVEGENEVFNAVAPPIVQTPHQVHQHHGRPHSPPTPIPSSSDDDAAAEPHPLRHNVSVASLLKLEEQMVPQRPEEEEDDNGLELKRPAAPRSTPMSTVP